MTDTATDRVNDVARGLQAKLAEAGFDISEHEAQALSIVGLIAAAGEKLDAEILEQGRKLVDRILTEGAANECDHLDTEDTLDSTKCRDCGKEA